MTTLAPTFDPATLTDDPEIAALLAFEPVVRKCLRADGWWPEHQYRFILGVAETGKPDQVAHALGGRTFSGAWKLRKAGGGEGFSEAWDKAKALHLKRNPPARRPLPEPPARSRGRARTRGGDNALTPEEEARERAEFFHKLMDLYWAKAKAERRCRLEGRIVAADFYVRQLTCIELAADLSEHGQAFLAGLKRGDTRLTDAVATPLSFCFDYLRRCAWEASGEPERPELPAFFRVKDGVATGEPSHYNSARAGVPWKEWARLREIEADLAAEAQRLWEERAKAAAERWRERLERDDPDRAAAILGAPELELAPDYAAELNERDDEEISSPRFRGEGDHPQDGGGASSVGGARGESGL